MAFGQSTPQIQPVEREKASPASMKLAYRPKRKKSEVGETPAMEAANHPPSFLKKAASMAKY